MTEEGRWLSNAYNRTVFYCLTVGSKIFAEKEKDEYAIYVFPEQMDAALYAIAVDKNVDSPFKISAVGLRTIHKAYCALVDDAGAASVILSSCTEKGDLMERDVLFSDRRSEPH